MNQGISLTKWHNIANVLLSKLTRIMVALPSINLYYSQKDHYPRILAKAIWGVGRPQQISNAPLLKFDATFKQSPLVLFFFFFFFFLLFLQVLGCMVKETRNMTYDRLTISGARHVLTYYQWCYSSTITFCAAACEW